ncbi:YhcH/YjgK/YiaL family protein [Cohnella sp. WQ 127256]|uniref:YhcH/YjgK/YiaL family protein n=1 Tax=Cohnella sp. WQ 127256 TaxID=2938790 RepID=UPI0035580653
MRWFRKEDQLNHKDIAFYGEIADESSLILTHGSFVILFPGEIHRPCCCVGEESRVKKVVIKVHRRLLES